MRKFLLVLMICGITGSLTSCRESTQQKTEDAAKAIGKDIKEGAEKAGDKMEEGAEKLKQEIDEEIHDTDDVNGEEAADDME
jgi:hypothetical protein